MSILAAAISMIRRGRGRGGTRGSLIDLWIEFGAATGDGLFFLNDWDALDGGFMTFVIDYSSSPFVRPCLH